MQSQKQDGEAIQPQIKGRGQEALHGIPKDEQELGGFGGGL